MKNILLIAQLTSFALASGSLEEVTTIAAAPTMQLASAEPTALIPNHVDPNNLPPAWPKPISSITSTHNHTTASTSAATAVHPPTTTYLTNVHVPTTTAATDTYPPGPAAFYSTGVNLGAAAKSSGLTTSSSCTSTKITSKSTHTMTTTHTIPALPPSEVTLPVQSQHGGEHHESGLGGGMVNGTGVAHGTGTKKHWPTQPAGHHGKPPGVAGVHPSGMPSSHCEHETGTTQHKPTRAAGRHERPQGQDCAHPSGMSNAQVRYGTGAAPAKSTQSPWEPGHPMGPPPGVSPKEWQQHGGEHGQGRQAGQHSYPGVDGTGTFVWAPAPHTTTLKAPGTTIYTSTRTIFLTVFATATTHATTTLLPLADADMTSIWTPDVWSSQHRNSTQHKNGPTAFAGDPVWTSRASTLSTAHHTTSPSTHTTSTSHHTTSASHSTPSTVTTAKPHPLMNTDLTILSSLRSLESLLLTGGTVMPSGHAAPTGLPAARANCTMTFTKRPEFFECTSTKYQSTTTTFMDCHGCTGKHVTTVIGKDAHTECYSTRSTTVIIRPTGADGAVLPFSTHTTTSTHHPTSAHTLPSPPIPTAHGTGSLARPTQPPATKLKRTKRATPSSIIAGSVSIAPAAGAPLPKIVNPKTGGSAHTTTVSTRGLTKSTTGLVVAVTGTVSGHYTSYITTLEIVKPTPRTTVTTTHTTATIPWDMMGGP